MQKILILTILSLFVSCSTMRKVGVKVIAGGIGESSKDIQKETDWNYFKDSIPGNLKLMETMLSMDPSNKEILTALIQGFVGYAFGIHETQYISDQLKEVEDSEHLKAAISYYSKALSYGEMYLLERGVDRSQIVKLINEQSKLTEYLSSNLSESDYKAIFYTAQAWGSLINLQRTNMILMSELPGVKSLFDFVCLKKPDFEFGACDLFYASYEIGRPKLLGGNPEKGKQIFKDFIKKYPLNLLGQVMYIQLAVIPEANKKEFENMAEGLDEDFEIFMNLNNKGIYKENKFDQAPYVKLFNAIAYKRYLIINKFKKEIF